MHACIKCSTDIKCSYIININMINYSAEKMDSPSKVKVTACLDH